MVLRITEFPLRPAPVAWLPPQSSASALPPGQSNLTQPSAPDRHPPDQQRAQNDYATLLRAVRERGLLQRRYFYYAAKGAGLAVATAIVWVAFALIGDSWIQLVVAAAFGVVLTHVAFLSHDAAHRQIFRSGPANEWLATCLGGLVMGMSAAWWQHKHTRHEQ